MTEPPSTVSGPPSPADLIRAEPATRVPAVAVGRRYLLAALSLVATLFTTTTLGAGWYLSTRTDVTTDLLPWLGADTIRRVWTDPELLRIGLNFSLPVVLILLCHELGHYLFCLRYSVPATAPVFLPAPIGLGTFGAFIRIRAPIRNKRQLLDIGAAGPIAGFVALLPFLLYGIARSRPAPLLLAQPQASADLLLMLPGRSLGMHLATLLFHGPLPAGYVLDLHPFALAAWIGLLATSLNLLPLGQLDGGHILYAALGPLQRKLALPLWLGLAAAGLLFWRGWLVWCVLVLLFGLRHQPVYDERQPLDRRRLGIALLTLAILVLSFIPVPVSVVGVRF